MINDYLIYVGLEQRLNKSAKQKETETDKTPIIKQTYISSKDIKVAERYLTYLKEIHDYQRDRRTTIENKNSQLVGQASIVTSIFALFVPLLIDNLHEITIWIKLPLSILFITVLFHYLLSILHAIKTLTVDKYKYPSRSTISVTKDDRKENELDFINSEIEDLIYIINNTTPIDNIKGSNLIYGARCFKIGNIGFGIMTLLVIISTFTLNKETSEIKIKNLKDLKIQIPDTLNARIIDLKQKDIFTIKIDSMENKIYQINGNRETKK
jgi:hypothetical protein